MVEIKHKIGKGEVVIHHAEVHVIMHGVMRPFHTFSGYRVKVVDKRFEIIVIESISKLIMRQEVVVVDSINISFFIN